MKVFETCFQYSKRNIFHAIISDIVEKVDERVENT